MANRVDITEITAPVAASDDRTPLAVHLANEDQGGMKIFATKAERDTFTKSFRVRCYKSVAIVGQGENNFPSIYHWTGTQPNGSDGGWEFAGYYGGVVLADSGGAIPKIRGTLVLGDDFEIQEAGNQGFGALIQLSDKAKQSGSGDGMITVGTYQQPTTFSKGTTLELEWPLKAWPDEDKEKAFRVSMDHDAFEPMSAPSFLGKASGLKLINAGVDAVIFCDKAITPYGMDFSPDAPAGGLRVQEDDGKDPNLGGQLTELLGAVNFNNKAPAAGNIKIWFMYHQNGAYLPTGYVTGTNGKPIIREKTFKVGDDMKMIIAGAYYAKGQETITMHVEHNFTGEMLIVNPDQTMLCVSQFTSGSETSLSRIEFQRRTGTSIIPAICHFDENYLKYEDFITGITQPEIDVNPNQGEEFISQFGIRNFSACKASLDRGILNIKDNGTDILDFYFDYLASNTRTVMMRGHEFNVKTKFANPSGGFNVALFSWSGKKDAPTQVYSSRNNGAIQLNAGWTKIGETFADENPQGTELEYTLTVTIPENSINLAFVVYPVEAQNPMNWSLSKFDIYPTSDFTAYIELERYNSHELYLDVLDSYIELGQNSESYVSLRYTLSANGGDWQFGPVGEVIKGARDWILDKSKAVITGSQATGGEGALVAPADGQVSLSCEYTLWNEQGTDNTAYFKWILFDVDGNESDIANSDINFMIPKNQSSHGIEKTQPSFVFEIEKGQSIALKMRANKDDGAYLESTSPTEWIVKPIIDFKKIITI